MTCSLLVGTISSTDFNLKKSYNSYTLIIERPNYLLCYAPSHQCSHDAASWCQFFMPPPEDQRFCTFKDPEGRDPLLSATATTALHGSVVFPINHFSLLTLTWAARRRSAKTTNTELLFCWVGMFGRDGTMRKRRRAAVVTHSGGDDQAISLLTIRNGCRCFLCLS